MDLQAWTSFGITWLIWNQRAGFDFYDSGSVLNFVKQTFFYFFFAEKKFSVSVICFWGKSISQCIFAQHLA